MDNDGRTRNSIKNMIYAIVSYFITVLLAFIERKIFVANLPEVYLGISGVMTNILNILAITELGFGEAIMFSLYKPIRENDERRIVALLNLYKQTYKYIVFLIAVLSFAVLFLLPVFFKNVELVAGELYIIYFLFVVNTLVSYFGAYRRSVIIAYQKRYIISAAHCICRTAFYVLRIIVLMCLQNYFWVLIVSVACTFAEAYSIFVVAGKKYPITKTREKISLSNAEKKQINKNIAAMAMHKIGGTLVTGTDNLLISWFVGVVEVGLYSNYILIKSTIEAITQSFFASMIASVGNLGNEDKIKAKQIFNTVFYASAWLFGWCSVCLICLYNDFILLWLGEKYILNYFSVVLIVISFYLTGMRQAVLMTRNAFGLFWKDRWKPAVEASINLVFSYVFASFLGLSGIVLGTIFSTLLTCFWVEPFVLFRYGFQENPRQYFKDYLVYTLCTLVSLFVTILICSCIQLELYLRFGIKMVICLVIPNVVFILLTSQRNELNFLKSKLIKRMWKRSCQE